MENNKEGDRTSTNTTTSSQDLHGAEHQHDLHNIFSPAYRAIKRWASTTVFLFFSMLLVGAFYFRIDVLDIRENFSLSTKQVIEFPLNCSEKGTPTTCKASYPATFEADRLSGAACPDYFRWIHEDLKPWKRDGISRDTLENAKKFATFRLVIINGTAYLEKYHNSFQTRDLFTIWGILQLLRLYPGRVPDLEIMFQCGDMPEIQKHDYQGQGPNNATSPPALFQYSGNDAAFAIIFPDWSFWGWAEVNIRPWKIMMHEIVKGSKRKKWKDRVPYAYWKGNPYVSPNRGDLMTCKASDKHDWNARLYVQDWGREIQHGFKDSHLEDQCTHRYKIYVEGRAWSVSAKYILACDSMTLLIKPDYYDFFMRSIVPLQHYWPIRKDNKCKDIKFAVEWGNNHTQKAQEIGKGGSKFIQENLKMESVYGYMFHLLSEYAKLMKFKPEVPKGGVEICSESMACSETGSVRKFLEESMVMSPSDTVPCAMPPPYDAPELQQIFQRKKNVTEQVVTWENEYWQNREKKPS